MADLAKYIKSKLNVDVPWNQLVGSDHLQTVLHAIVQRLDRQDQVLASHATSSPGGVLQGVTVIPSQDLADLRQRLAIVENHTLQGRVEQLHKASPLQVAAASTTQGLRLADHVIPLTQMKGRIEGCEVGVQANAEAVDRANQHIAQVAEALHRQLEEALAKMVTKEELQAVEGRVDELHAKVDAFDMKFDEIERKIVLVEAEVTKTNRRVDAIEERMDRAYVKLQDVESQLNTVETGVLELRETKAERAEVTVGADEVVHPAHTMTVAGLTRS